MCRMSIGSYLLDKVQVSDQLLLYFRFLLCIYLYFLRNPSYLPVSKNKKSFLMSQNYVYVAQKNESKVITGTNCLRKLLPYNTYKMYVYV